MTTQSYGLQLRERIVAARQDGHSAQELAKWFKVSKRSVERFWKSYQETDSVQFKQRGGYSAYVFVVNFGDMTREGNKGIFRKSLRQHGWMFSGRMAK